MELFSEAVDDFREAIKGESYSNAEDIEEMMLSISQQGKMLKEDSGNPAFAKYFESSFYDTLYSTVKKQHPNPESEIREKMKDS